MIEDKDFKFAESEEEELVVKTLENSRKAIIAMKVQLKMEENNHKFLTKLLEKLQTEPSEDD